MYKLLSNLLGKCLTDNLAYFTKNQYNWLTLTYLLSYQEVWSYIPHSFTLRVNECLPKNQFVLGNEIQTK